jgi:hypothetical protein
LNLSVLLANRIVVLAAFMFGFHDKGVLESFAVEIFLLRRKSLRNLVVVHPLKFIYASDHLGQWNRKCLMISLLAPHKRCIDSSTPIRLQVIVQL